MERKVKGPWCGWWAVAVSMESAVSSDSPMAAAAVVLLAARSSSACCSPSAASLSKSSALPPPPPPHGALLSSESLHEHQLVNRLHTSLASIRQPRGNGGWCFYLSNHAENRINTHVQDPNLRSRHPQNQRSGPAERGARTYAGPRNPELSNRRTASTIQLNDGPRIPPSSCCGTLQSNQMKKSNVVESAGEGSRGRWMNTAGGGGGKGEDGNGGGESLRRGDGGGAANTVSRGLPQKEPGGPGRGAGVGVRYLTVTAGATRLSFRRGGTEGAPRGCLPCAAVPGFETAWGGAASRGGGGIHRITPVLRGV
jgi:hypothetical protein